MKKLHVQAVRAALVKAGLPVIERSSPGTGFSVSQHGSGVLVSIGVHLGWRVRDYRYDEERKRLFGQFTLAPIFQDNRFEVRFITEQGYGFEDGFSIALYADMESVPEGLSHVHLLEARQMMINKLAKNKLEYAMNNESRLRAEIEDCKASIRRNEALLSLLIQAEVPAE